MLSTLSTILLLSIRRLIGNLIDILTIVLHPHPIVNLGSLPLRVCEIQTGRHRAAFLRARPPVGKKQPSSECLGQTLHWTSAAAGGGQRTNPSPTHRIARLRAESSYELNGFREPA